MPGPLLLAPHHNVYCDHITDTLNQQFTLDQVPSSLLLSDNQLGGDFHHVKHHQILFPAWPDYSLAMHGQLLQHIYYPLSPHFSPLSPLQSDNFGLSGPELTLIRFPTQAVPLTSQGLIWELLSLFSSAVRSIN